MNERMTVVCAERHSVVRHEKADIGKLIDQMCVAGKHDVHFDASYFGVFFCTPRLTSEFTRMMAFAANQNHR